MIHDLFYASVVARCDTACPATQDAIDSMGHANGQTRARMLNWLSRISDAELCDALLVAWACVPLELATGRNRDTWLQYFSSSKQEKE